MDEKLMEAITRYFEMQVAKEQAADAQKAAEPTPQYVTVSDLKEVFASFSGEVSKAIAEAVEAAMPVRAEGAGRAGDPAEAQKGADVNPIEALAKTPVDQLTPEQKDLKADIIRTIAVKGMK